MKNPDPLPLNASRLVLRRFRAEDVEAFLGYRNDPEVIRYQNWTGCTAAEAAEFIRRQQSQDGGVPGEWLQIAIALKATNELIGDCGVRVQAADARQATIGVSLARTWQGRGFAFEALSALFICLGRWPCTAWWWTRMRRTPPCRSWPCGWGCGRKANRARASGSRAAGLTNISTRCYARNGLAIRSLEEGGSP